MPTLERLKALGGTQNDAKWCILLHFAYIICLVKTLNRRFATSRLVIGTSRTVGSAKKFVRIASGFGGGEFTKTLRKVCTCQKLKLSFLLLENFDIDCLYHRQGNEQKQVAVHQI